MNTIIYHAQGCALSSTGTQVEFKYPLSEFEEILLNFTFNYFKNALSNTPIENTDIYLYPSNEKEKCFIADFEQYLEKNPGKEEIERRRFLENLNLK
jgi:hypothetical protein